jgi:hypothetical protein
VEILEPLEVSLDAGDDPLVTGDLRWPTAALGVVAQMLDVGELGPESGRSAESPRASGAAPEWVVNMGSPCGLQPHGPPSLLALFLSTQTHSTDAVVTRCARFPTPNPTPDDASRSSRLRA